MIGKMFRSALHRFTVNWKPSSFLPIGSVSGPEQQPTTTTTTKLKEEREGGFDAGSLMGIM